MAGSFCFGEMTASNPDSQMLLLCQMVAIQRMHKENRGWRMELSTPGKHHASYPESLYIRSKLQFTRHEAWALKAARKAPLFALFAVATLCVWLVLPMFLLGILLFILLEKAGILGAIICMVLGIVCLAIIAPWFFRWYFICAGLMIGRTRMADIKEEDISARFDRLSGALTALEQS